jgi:hypothetical protein
MLSKNLRLEDVVEVAVCSNKREVAYSNPYWTDLSFVLVMRAEERLWWKGGMESLQPGAEENVGLNFAVW